MVPWFSCKVWFLLKVDLTPRRALYKYLNGGCWTGVMKEQGCLSETHKTAHTFYIQEVTCITKHWQSNTIKAAMPVGCLFTLYYLGKWTGVWEKVLKGQFLLKLRMEVRKKKVRLFSQKGQIATPWPVGIFPSKHISLADLICLRKILTFWKVGLFLHLEVY